MRKLRGAILAVMVALGLIGGVATANAGATVSATTDWIMGAPIGDWYSGAGSTFADSTGIWMIGGDLHVYLVTAAHSLEDANNVCRGCAPFYSKYRLDGGVTNNWFDLFSVKWNPPNASTVDVALVDFGLVTGLPGQLAGTDKLYSYCNPSRSDIARCSSWLGGGWGSNPMNQGNFYDNVGGSGPSFGMYVCKSGSRSGTSCGTVTGSHLVQTLGYAYWGYDVTGLDRCGVNGGDSGGVVYADQGNLQSVVVGLVTVGQLNQTDVGGVCYPAGEAYGNSLTFIGVDQIQGWFSPWTGGSLTVIT